MYEVTTINKVMLKTADKDTAIWWAEILFNNHNYVEVKEIVSESPWYARSIKVFNRKGKPAERFKKSFKNS